MTDSGATCVCVPPPPMGWTYVAYQVDLPDASTSCMGDFSKQSFTKETSGGGSPMCSCTCMPNVAATCSIDKMTITIAGNNACNANVATFSNVTPDVNGCYNNMDYGQNVEDYYQGTATFKIDGTCTPMENNIVPPRTDHLGQACALTGALGSGCTTPTDQCVPKVPAGYLQCVESAGANLPCPMDFPNAHHVGEGVNDDRGCTPCMCNPSANCSATFEPRDNDTCTSGNSLGNPMALDNTCRDSLQNHDNIKSFKTVTSTGSPGCAKSGNAATGSISLAMERTICCQN